MKELFSKKNLKNIGIRTAGTISIPVVFVVVVLIVCVASGRQIFPNDISKARFTQDFAVITLTTLALSINLGSGRFDFSLGSMATLSTVISAKITYAMLQNGSGTPVVMLLFCIIFGAVLGALSGGLYVLMKIPPIIASLGITLVYEGLIYIIGMFTEGEYIKESISSSSMYQFSFNWYWPLLIAIAAVAIIYIVYDHTTFGRNYSALRDGQNVAVNTGIKEIPNAIICYLICGALMGGVGFIQSLGSTHQIASSQLNFGTIGVMFTAFLPMFMGGFIGRFSNDKLGYLLAGFSMAFVDTMFNSLEGLVDTSVKAIVPAALLVVFLIFLNNQETCKDLVTGRLFKKWIAKFKEWKAKRANKKASGEV